MHNCNETREQLTELLLDGDVRAESVLDQCEECRAEFEALAATLRMTARTRETVVPSEDYWTSYHAQLRQRLTDAREGFHAKAQRPGYAKAQREELKPGLGFVFSSLRQPLRLCVKTFLLPVPVPLGVAVLAVGLVLALFAIRASRQPVQPPIVVQTPVEVPVVQEKVVTQVVYRDRWRVSKPSKQVVSGPTVESTVARSQKPLPEDTLSGFKPTDEVKLTVIKGGSPNEK
ncbi:MAG TPA: hypothetical protein VFT08_02985 [Pyrinomonadaceae bacterium]|nr:hypothetical protein [Pyrinomonadaceae bacterium]